MNRVPSTSARRLKAMGIDLWQSRPVRMPHAVSPAPRIRLAAGSGDWLLVCPEGVPETYRRLVDDIVASIGVARCRFGEWADSADAGVAVDEWQSRGIEHVLAFAEDDAGRRPGRARLDDPRVIDVAALAELAQSGAARKALWHQLADRLSR